jgi:hypothetical protein
MPVSDGNGSLPQEKAVERARKNDVRLTRRKSAAERRASYDTPAMQRGATN